MKRLTITVTNKEGKVLHNGVQEEGLSFGARNCLRGDAADALQLWADHAPDEEAFGWDKVVITLER